MGELSSVICGLEFPILVIPEGEIIPVDGIVVDGLGAVDESAVSGESIPRERSVGQRVHINQYSRADEDPRKVV